MQINNFEVEIFNQYKLPENAKRSVCPLCSHNRKVQNQKVPVLMIDWDRGLAHCCHCGETIQLHTYKKRNVQPKREYKRPVWENRTQLDTSIVQWFESRGISQYTLQLMRISQKVEYMTQVGREMKVMCFNYFRDDELINIKYRPREKMFKLFSGGELIMYNLNNCRISKDVIICEGEIDTLSFVEAGLYHVLSVPNGSTLGNANLEYIDNCIEYFQNKERIYLALDNDEAGKNVTKELIRRFGAEKCYLVDFLDCKDANEYLVKYGKEKLSKILESAKEVPIEGVSSLKDWEEEFDDYLVNGMKKGYVTGIASFDSIFSTYTGQYIVVTGIPSAGKSDFVDMMCLGYNHNYGWKIAVASPENKPNWRHAGKIISKLCGKWVNRQEYLNEKWCYIAKDKINDTFKYIDLDGSYDLESVLNKARELIFKFGIKVLIIDPYNKVKLKESANKSINDYTNDYLLRIDEFSRKHDILIILVAHPNKPSGEERKNYEPDFYSVKGGGEFYDMSPHGILVHRDKENNLVKIKTLKVKFAHLGENGKFVWLQWNKNNGRYMDFKYQSEDPKEVKLPAIDDSNWMYESKEETEAVYDVYPVREDLPF